MHLEETTRRHMGQLKSAVFALTLIMGCAAGVAAAEEACDATCLAKKAQDPLADVKAIMTDNAIAFGTADNETSYSFQIQPVYSIQTSYGFNVIPRAVIPIVGVPAAAGIPKLGTTPATASGTTWGLSDTIAQVFVTPHTDASIKFGFGPQVSLRTRTNERASGPGWGAGMAGIVFGNAGPLAYGAIAHHHWGQNNFSLTSVQPMLMYNFESVPGLYAGYNNTVTYDWSASSGDQWQVPLGAMVGRTFPIGDGRALDLSLGAYGMAAKPTGGADAEVRFTVNMFF